MRIASILTVITAATSAAPLPQGKCTSYVDSFSAFCLELIRPLSQVLVGFLVGIERHIVDQSLTSQVAYLELAVVTSSKVANKMVDFLVRLAHSWVDY
jgi:hypothetical protein